MPTWSRIAFMRTMETTIERRALIVVASVSSTPRLTERAHQQLACRAIGIELAPGYAIDDRRQLAWFHHAPLEMVHEPLRHELAQAVLAARPPPARLHRRGIVADAPDR